MADRSYPSFQANCKRAFFFLNLAVEQLRFIDVKAADTVSRIYIPTLEDIFSHAIQSSPPNDLREDEVNHAHQLSLSGEDMYNAILREAPQAPPGLGRGLLPEKISQRPRVSESSEEYYHRTLRSLSTAFGDPLDKSRDAKTAGLRISSKADRLSMQGLCSGSAASGHSTSYSLGAIGDRRRHAPQSNISGLFRNSESLIQHALSDDVIIHDYYDALERMSQSPPGGVPFPSSDFDNIIGHGTSSTTLSTRRARVSPKSSTSSSRAIMASDREKVDSAMGVSPSLEPFSWAKVAAIPKEVVKAAKPIPVANASQHFSGHLTSTLSRRQTILNPPPTFAAAAAAETEADRLRVVWVANLPKRYGLRDISSRISQGPLMSILLENDVTPELPGRSACIIFQKAEHASAFLIANEQAARDAKIPQAFDATHPRATSVFSDAVGAQIILGVPYALDADLASMEAQPFARRRIKWSRARLFHEITLAAFKMEVYRLCGAQNVELIHFYNPGEVTAVFASVKVAAYVLGVFANKAKEKGGKYEGVDCSFCKDFNECPPGTLWSSFGRDGRVRRVSDEKGLEGLFSGPNIVGGVSRNA